METQVIKGLAEEGRRPTTLFLGMMGAKGGSGVSMFAATLASVISRERKLLMLDLDSNSSHRCSFEKNGFPGISNLIMLIGENGADALQHLIREHPMGFHLLPGFRVPEEEGLLTSEKLNVIYEHLSRHYDLILIDVSSNHHMMVNGALNPCELILLITRPDLLSLHCALRNQELVERVKGIGSQRWGLVINGFSRATLIRPHQITDALQIPLVAILPEDPQAAENFSNLGKRPSDNSPFLEAITGMASRLGLIDQPAQATSRRFYSGLKRALWG